MMLACVAGSAQATIRVWSLATGGNFSTATNWSPSSVPQPGDQLIVDLVGTNTFVCDGLAPETGIEQWRRGTMNWSTTNPHTVTGTLAVAGLSGLVGTLRITSGEMITSGFLRVGEGNGAVGTLTLEGPDSLLTCGPNAATFIGSPGTSARGTLNVNLGARVVSSRDLELHSGTTIGSRLSVNGTGSSVTLLGPDADLIGGRLTGGFNEIVVLNGGSIATQASVLLGRTQSEGGTLRLGDATSTTPTTLTVGGDLRLGNNPAGGNGGFGSAEFLRRSMVSVAGDVYLGDDSPGNPCTMTINQTAGGPFSVSCRDLHLGANGVLALEDGRFNVNGSLFVHSGNFVLDTSTSSGGGFMVLLGNAPLNTLRVAVAHSGSLISLGRITCDAGVTVGEQAGSFGQLDIHTGGELAAGGNLEVGRAGHGIYFCSGLASTAVNELLVGSAAGGLGEVFVDNASMSCAQAAFGRVGGGSSATMNFGVGADYSCTGSTVLNPGSTVNWAGDTYVSGRTLMSGGTLNAAGVLGGRIGGGSGVIVANQDLTLGDGTLPNGYETGAMLVVGPHDVTVGDADRAVGSVTIAGGALGALNGWEIPGEGSLDGFGTMGECVARGPIRPTGNGLVFEGLVTTSGGIDGTSVVFARGLIAEGEMSAQVSTLPGTFTVITGPATIGDGSALGADLHGTLVTSDDALVLRDDDGIGGGDFSLTLGFGTVFVESVVRIDPGASLRGVGFVDSPRLAVGGDIYPGAHDGDDVGAINTSGLLRPSGRFAHFHIDLAGAGEGQADAVFAGGGIVLSDGTEGATLTVREINGYAPAVRDRIQILGGPVIDGEFESVNAPIGWTVEYESTGVFLRYGCESDFTGDGAVDGDDVIAFFEAWDSGAIEGDVTGDGSTDGDDVIFFFGHWDSGC
jgi:hypothetical protein